MNKKAKIYLEYIRFSIPLLDPSILSFLMIMLANCEKELDFLSKHWNLLYSINLLQNLSTSILSGRFELCVG